MTTPLTASLPMYNLPEMQGGRPRVLGHLSDALAAEGLSGLSGLPSELEFSRPPVPAGIGAEVLLRRPADILCTTSIAASIDCSAYRPMTRRAAGMQRIVPSSWFATIFPSGNLPIYAAAYSHSTAGIPVPGSTCRGACSPTSPAARLPFFRDVVETGG